MKKAPYSLSEAENICKEFQHLTGKPFSKGSDLNIDCIAITPFDEVNKKRFVLYYLLFDDAETALTHEYRGLLYDVMVMACSKDGHELLHEDIYTWLEKNKYLPVYSTELTDLIPKPVRHACL